MDSVSQPPPQILGYAHRHEWGRGDHQFFDLGRGTRDAMMQIFLMPSKFAAKCLHSYRALGKIRLMFIAQQPEFPYREGGVDQTIRRTTLILD